MRTVWRGADEKTPSLQALDVLGLNTSSLPPLSWPRLLGNFPETLEATMLKLKFVEWQL